MPPLPASRNASGYFRVLLGVNAGNAIEFYDWMAYALLVPYFGWVGFATALNAAIWFLNLGGAAARP